MQKRRVSPTPWGQIIGWSVVLGFIISLVLHFFIIQQFYGIRLNPPSEVGNITLSNLTVMYNGSPQTPEITTEPFGMNYTLTFDTIAMPPAGAGTYIVIATIMNETYGGTTQANFTILPANQTIMIAPPLRTNYSTGEHLNFTVTSSSGQVVESFTNNHSLFAPSSLFGFNFSQQSLTFIAAGSLHLLFVAHPTQNYTHATLSFNLTINGSDYQICTPGSTLACPDMAHATALGYRAICNSQGQEYVHNGTCTYRCATRYVTNGTACISGGTTFGRNQSLVQVDGTGLFIAPNATNASYLVLAPDFAQTRLATISLTIEDPDESEAYLIIHNLSLTSEETKTVVLKAKRSRSNAVCIADRADVFTRADIERRCFALLCPGTNGTYSCEREENRFIVSGLRHSGILEERITAPPASATSTTVLPASTQTPSSAAPLPAALPPHVVTFHSDDSDPLASSSIRGEDATLTLSQDTQQSSLSARLATLLAGGNTSLLYLELGFFALIVLLLIGVLFAYSHFARQRSVS